MPPPLMMPDYFCRLIDAAATPPSFLPHADAPLLLIADVFAFPPPPPMSFFFADATPPFDAFDIY